MGDKDPYLLYSELIGNMKNILSIDLKRDTMMFEADGIKVVQPLDPCLGPRYIEALDHNMESYALDQLYTITVGTRPDYINATADGSISYRSIQYVDEDLELAFDSWQQGSYERFSRRCATVK
jgi:hypothetical protein